MDKSEKNERKAVRDLIAKILEKGWLISVNDGEEWVLKKSADAKAIFKASMSTDGDVYIVRSSDGNTKIGSIVLVYGNEPYEVVNDWGWNQTSPKGMEAQEGDPYGFNSFMEEFSKYLEKFERW